MGSTWDMLGNPVKAIEDRWKWQCECARRRGGTPPPYPHKEVEEYTEKKHTSTHSDFRPAMRITKTCPACGVDFKPLQKSWKRALSRGYLMVCDPCRQSGRKGVAA